MVVIMTREPYGRKCFPSIMFSIKAHARWPITALLVGCPGFYLSLQPAAMLTVNKFTQAKRESTCKVNVSRNYVLGKTRKNFETLFSWLKSSSHLIDLRVCIMKVLSSFYYFVHNSSAVHEVFYTQVKLFLINIIREFRLQILQRDLSFGKRWLCFCYVSRYGECFGIDERLHVRNKIIVFQKGRFAVCLFICCCLLL